MASFKFFLAELAFVAAEDFIQESAEEWGDIWERFDAISERVDAY
ncbi:hypothetical protein [Chroococcidiopsis sp.]